MAAPLTSKQKAFLVVLAAFLVFTLVGRLSYSKQFHGLLCAARTFHQIATSDTREIVEADHEGIHFLSDAGKPQKDIVKKITKLKAEQIQQQIKIKKVTKRVKEQPNTPAESKNKRHTLPQAIIIGVRKCGTRALLEMLETHPQIAACGPEIHFFDKSYSKGLDWYRLQMKPSTAGQITIEKTPAYYITPEAPERIYRMNRNVKLLVIVRDPTTRTISDFTQLNRKPTSSLHNETFERVVMDGSHIQTSYKAVQISTYVNYVDSWLKYFPLSQIHFVDGGKLITNPLPELKEVEKFLGINDFISSDMIYFNKTRGFYCIRSELNSKCLSSNKGAVHPDVSQDVVTKLQEFFRPYNNQFFKKINQHFDWP